ncbi:glycine receptor subunit alpha-4-like isoform X2 [Neocloeon triangulifer]|uniref:glycine receptor subunit alpha-4-like isoform X2 n=1 Tax=Neocloeon triangulifer TaxID=2078957 RepID=UPI00286EEC51|nr:glycine receptor subunit alpha-4-like isoform X2 [Neocloeon triangulifer]
MSHVRVLLAWCALSCLASIGAIDFWTLDDDYNKNLPPGKNMVVSVSLFINRVSSVDENKEEIAIDVFLQVYWEDPRVHLVANRDHVELTWAQRHSFWVPDLYIRQLRDMRLMQVFQEMASVRLYANSTFRVSIGATVIIKCDMDFDLYPLDIQRCAVDFSSYKYTVDDMTFKWRDDPALSFPSDFGDGYRLPKYVVSFNAEQEEQVIFYGEGNHSTARLMITLSRELQSYLLETYLPSSLFVTISWGSFIVNPELVPGRMVLLVTTLLSLVTMFDTVRNNSPNALELKCIEVWLISCILFVFVALLEYFVVLFAMRYDKHWRRNKAQNSLGIVASLAARARQARGSMSAASGGPPAVQISSEHGSPRRDSSARMLPTNNHFHATLATPEDDTAECSLDDVHVNCINRKSPSGDRLAVLRRVFPRAAMPPLATPEVLQPDDGLELQERGMVDHRESAVYTFRETSPQRRSFLLPMSPRHWPFLCGSHGQRRRGATSPPPEQRDSLTDNEAGGSIKERRSRAFAEYCVSFCGSSRGTLDQGSLLLFPLVFILFTIVYWVSYMSEAAHRVAIHS